MLKVMKYILRPFYWIYQYLIAWPILVLLTAFTAFFTICTVRWRNAEWVHKEQQFWSRSFFWLMFLPVTVDGEEHIQPGQSYVFVSNHQGAFDIFLIFGHLCRNFKWMMKHQLKKIPFVGYACEKSNQIFVDKRGPSKIKQTYEKARDILKHGISVVVFPEGARSFTGHMGTFRRGAFMLADELQLPVVPLTINGSFYVMPRTKDWHFVHWHPLSLTIHKPIEPTGHGADNIKNAMDKSYTAIMSALAPEHQGFIENPDQ
jgi:1-acyl-sn-glycerol-3-phosphate acyltransferase